MNIVQFDQSLYYELPMSKASENETKETRTICKLTQNKFQCMFTAIEPGYRPKAFADKHVEYLLYTGYIKIINNKRDN